MDFNQANDELNWDVLSRLGWTIRASQSFEGEFVICDPQGEVLGTDAGDPYGRAKRLGNVPLYPLDLNSAVRLLEEIPYVLTHDSRGYTLSATVNGESQIVLNQSSLAVAICRLFIMIKDVSK